MSTKNDAAETNKPEFKLSDDQRSVIEELSNHQAKLGLTDVQFAGAHLNYSHTVWLRVKSGEYWKMIADPAGVLLQLQNDLAALVREMAIKTRNIGTDAYHKFSDYETVGKAVDVCRTLGISNPVRLIVYLADTGGGKTKMCRQLAVEKNAYVIEARQAWKSYFVALRDIASGIGVNVTKLFSTGEIEDRLVKRLNARKTLLCIDEGEFFTAETLNLIKFILNQTPTVILLCAIPAAYDAWVNKNQHEARQIIRRTHLLVRHQPITPKQVHQFLMDVGLNGTLPTACTRAAKGANQFGNFEFLSRLREKLIADKSTTIEDVDKACTTLHARMGAPVGN